MDLLDALTHLLNFLAPAAGVAVLVSLATHIWRRRSGYRLRLWQVVAINFIVSAVASVAAIMVLGRDGTMSGYAALVLAAASTQWVLGRGWRG